MIVKCVPLSCANISSIYMILRINAGKRMLYLLPKSFFRKQVFPRIFENCLKFLGKNILEKKVRRLNIKNSNKNIRKMNDIHHQDISCKICIIG